VCVCVCVLCSCVVCVCVCVCMYMSVLWFLGDCVRGPQEYGQGEGKIGRNSRVQGWESGVCAHVCVRTCVCVYVCMRV